MSKSVTEDANSPCKPCLARFILWSSRSEESIYRPQSAGWNRRDGSCDYSYQTSRRVQPTRSQAMLGQATKMYGVSSCRFDKNAHDIVPLLTLNSPTKGPDAKCKTRDRFTRLVDSPYVEGIKGAISTVDMSNPCKFHESCGLFDNGECDILESTNCRMR